MEHANLANALRADAASVRRDLERLRPQKGVERRTAAVDGQVFVVDHWRLISAALGVSGIGATLLEVYTRTGLGQNACSAGLEQLLERGVITFCARSARFLPEKAHMFFTALGEDAAYKPVYLRNLKRLAQQAQLNFACMEALFMNTVFSVERERMTEFKEQLRNLIAQFAEGAENPRGDTVATLVCGLYPAGQTP